MLVGDRRRTPMKQLADPLVKDSAVLENLVRLLIWTPFCRIQREDLQEEDRRAKGRKREAEATIGDGTKVAQTEQIRQHEEQPRPHARAINDKEAT